MKVDRVYKIMRLPKGERELIREFINRNGGACRKATLNLVPYIEQLNIHRRVEPVDRKAMRIEFHREALAALKKKQKETNQSMVRILMEAIELMNAEEKAL